jgi:NADPH:quinone reductase-like Zn-dependent oxidoreductase
MRAVRIDRYGGTEVLELIDAAVPRTGPGQVLIEVHGSSVNPADIAIRSGWMAEYVPLTLPIVMGIDVAGLVTEVGDGVTELEVGEPVYGSAAVMMGGSGSFAEYAVSSPRLLARAPANVDLSVAGALPLAGISALEAVMDRLQVASGSRVLVHGSPGGVGSVAVALYNHLAALEPFDHTLDLVGQDPVQPVTLTKRGGRVVGLRLPPDLDAAAEKGVTAQLQGTEITTERLDRLREFVEQGIVEPHIAQTFALADIREAFAAKEAGGVHGKVAVAIR